MLTKEKIEEIVRNMKEKRINPFVIETQEEADYMNATSITPYSWSIGDEYYKLDGGKIIGADKC